MPEPFSFQGLPYDLPDPCHSRGLELHFLLDSWATTCVAATGCASEHWIKKDEKPDEPSGIFARDAIITFEVKRGNLFDGLFCVAQQVRQVYSSSINYRAEISGDMSSCGDDSENS